MEPIASERFLSPGDRAKLARLRALLKKRKDELELQAQVDAAQQTANTEGMVELHATIDDVAPGATALVQQALEDPTVTPQNFKQRVRDKLSAMKPFASWLGYAMMNTLVSGLYLLFVFYYTQVTTTPDAQRSLSYLGSPQFYLDPAKTLAPANGESVVDAVFAKAERKAATR